MTNSFSRIRATVIIRGEKDVKQEYTHPKFTDFSAQVVLDKHSNR